MRKLIKKILVESNDLGWMSDVPYEWDEQTLENVLDKYDIIFSWNGGRWKHNKSGDALSVYKERNGTFTFADVVHSYEDEKKFILKNYNDNSWQVLEFIKKASNITESNNFDWVGEVEELPTSEEELMDLLETHNIVFKYLTGLSRGSTIYTLSLRTHHHLFKEPLKITHGVGNYPAFYPPDTILYMLWSGHIKVLDFVKKNINESNGLNWISDIPEVSEESIKQALEDGFKISFRSNPLNKDYTMELDGGFIKFKSNGETTATPQLISIFSQETVPYNINYAIKHVVRQIKKGNYILKN